MKQSVLILGGSGRFGRHVTIAFAKAGWQVHQFNRATGDLMQAAQGMDVIVAACNPDYHHWAKDVPPLHAKIRAAALASNATVILPGNVYVFGETTPAPWGETTPHKATNPLGRIRIDMEAAYKREGVRTIILRAGDFLDTEKSGAWFDRILIKSLNKGVLTYPGRPDIPHAWAYLPDTTRAAVMLAEKRAALERFEVVPFGGYTLTAEKMGELIAKARGKPVTVKQMLWFPLKIAKPFMPLLSGLLEMRYLWNTPHQLDNGKLQRFLPDFVATPAQDAIRHCL